MYRPNPERGWPVFCFVLPDDLRYINNEKLINEKKFTKRQEIPVSGHFRGRFDFDNTMVLW